MSAFDSAVSYVGGWLTYLIEKASSREKLIKKLGKTLGIIVALTTSRYVLVKIKHKIRNYPPGPIGVPFLGCLPSFGGDTKRFLSNIAVNYGDIVYVPLIQQDNIFLNNPKLVKKLFKQKDFINHWSNYNEFRPVAGFDILNGQQWKQRRQFVMQSLFVLLKSDFIAKQIGLCMNEYFKNVNKDSIDIDFNGNDFAGYCAFNNIFSAIFGKNLTLNEKDRLFRKEYIKATKLKFDAIGGVMLADFAFNRKLPDYLMWEIISPYRKYEAQLDNILLKWMENNNYEVNVAMNKMEYHGNNNSNNNNNNDINKDCFILDLINKLKEGSMQASEIISDLNVLLTAAIDTTGQSSEIGFLLLAKNAQIQELAYQELVSVISKYNKSNNEMHGSGLENLEFTFEVLNDLHVFRALIHEMLRIGCVTGGGVPHQVTKDITIEHENKTYTFPKNALIHYNTFFIMKKQLWDENNTILYENGRENNDIHLEYWLDSNNDNHFKMNDNFILFGTGSRDCVGQAMAKKAIYAMFAMLMLKYKFVAPNNDTNSINLEQEWNLVQTLKYPINIKLVPRMSN